MQTISQQQEELVRLESKLEGLETSLVKNRRTFEKIRETVEELRQAQAVIKSESKAVRAKGRSPVNKTFASVSKADLVFASIPASQCDIQVLCTLGLHGGLGGGDPSFVERKNLTITTK